MVVLLVSVLYILGLLLTMMFLQKWNEEGDILVLLLLLLLVFFVEYWKGCRTINLGVMGIS